MHCLSAGASFLVNISSAFPLLEISSCIVIVYQQMRLSLLISAVAISLLEISSCIVIVLDLDRPNGPGSNDEHSVHIHHRDFTVTPIADQIGRIDSVSKTEYYYLKNHFSEPQCKMTVLPLNSGKPRFDPC
ncbi:hypothetical protein F511_26275 [Dorcoceras hygrometricum]|uniref:Uncharacterized protein n=1 Tax=Dorcoceras hygrometricum TaxID=472368 RepID=A0A2Z7DF06_9LAMI|nr:hypothetical protein F511_26275 [Dorcoceras hygrometricum]